MAQSYLELFTVDHPGETKMSIGGVKNNFQFIIETDGEEVDHVTFDKGQVQLMISFLQTLMANA